jgi:hypothetical protein
MPKYVRVENEHVVECLDYLPDGASGDWRQAVDVVPELLPGRQVMGTHHFDISKSPVEIVWSVLDISVEDRKKDLMSNLNSKSFNLVYEELIKEFNGQLSNLAYVQASIEVYREKKAEINALQTHDEIDVFVSANG